jgi:hypothetical protein
MARTHVLRMMIGMRIFVSSTFEDLREHRGAAIRVLRQLGHEVLAMEGSTSDSVCRGDASA